jgi:hypothetical protein
VRDSTSLKHTLEDAHRRTHATTDIVESNIDRLNQIYDSTAATLDSLVTTHTRLLTMTIMQEEATANESALPKQTGHDDAPLILMVRDEEILRTIETMRAIAIEIEDDSTHNDDDEMAEQHDHDLELHQMQEDILYEENAITERIVTAYGEPYYRGSDTYIYGDPDSDGYDPEDASSVDERNPYPYACPSLPEFTDDDINENTDTEDGAEEVIEIIGANARLITMIAKQGEDVIELIGANTQLVALIAKQRETMARLRARIGSS